MSVRRADPGWSRCVVDTAGEKSPPDELWISPRPWCGGLPRHPVGWLLLTVGLSVTGSGVAGGYARYGLVARPGELPAARWVAIYSPATTLVGLAPGRVRAAADSDRVPAVAPLAVVGLRYRLYDLGRIISRTLAYGLLTVLLGGGYALVVLGLGQLIGRDSSLVVAAATLAVAAAFQPARRRVQAAVDRRFNRRRHDAAQTIAAFGDRLRQQVDLDTLPAELVAVVGQTMQPTSVSLWLRPSRSPEVPASTGTG